MPSRRGSTRRSCGSWSWVLFSSLRSGRRRGRVRCGRNGCVGAFGKKVLLHLFGFARRHGEDGAVQRARCVVVINCDGVDLGTKQAEETAAAVGPEHRNGPDHSSDRALAVLVGDNIADGRRRHVRLFLAGGELKGSLLTSEYSRGVVLHSLKPENLLGPRKSSRLLRHAR